MARMVERLGLVLYWLGCGLAVATLLFAAYVVNFGKAESFVIVFMIIFAALCWGVGRACKFVLTGR